jgi:hypothetical protein
MEEYIDICKPASYRKIIPSQQEVLEKSQKKVDQTYSDTIINGERISIDEERFINEQKKLNKDFDRKLSQFDSILKRIKDPELCDYLIICNTILFGRPEKEELYLIKLYKQKFGSIKTIKEHIQGGN